MHRPDPKSPRGSTTRPTIYRRRLRPSVRVSLCLKLRAPVPFGSTTRSVLNPCDTLRPDSHRRRAENGRLVLPIADGSTLHKRAAARGVMNASVAMRKSSSVIGHRSCLLRGSSHVPEMGGELFLCELFLVGVEFFEMSDGGRCGRSGSPFADRAGLESDGCEFAGAVEGAGEPSGVGFGLVVAVNEGGALPVGSTPRHSPFVLGGSGGGHGPTTDSGSITAASKRSRSRLDRVVVVGALPLLPSFRGG